MLSSIALSKETPSKEIMLSSIALLQERFRELERMKEIREGRCLGQFGMNNNATLWPSKSVLVLSTSEKPSSWFFHPDLLCPARPLFETKFLCLMDGTNESISIGLQPASLASEETDIDTSLHL